MLPLYSVNEPPHLLWSKFSISESQPCTPLTITEPFLIYYTKTSQLCAGTFTARINFARVSNAIISFQLSREEPNVVYYIRACYIIDLHFRSICHCVLRAYKRHPFKPKLTQLNFQCVVDGTFHSHRLPCISRRIESSQTEKLFIMYQAENSFMYTYVSLMVTRTAFTVIKCST